MTSMMINMAKDLYPINRSITGGRPYQMIIRKGLPVSCQVTHPYYLPNEDLVLRFKKTNLYNTHS